MLSARERSERAARIERTRLVDFVSLLARGDGDGGGGGRTVKDEWMIMMMKRKKKKKK